MNVIWRKCVVCDDTTIQRQKKADSWGTKYRYWCHIGHWADDDTDG